MVTQQQLSPLAMIQQEIQSLQIAHSNTQAALQQQQQLQQQDTLRPQSKVSGVNHQNSTISVKERLSIGADVSKITDNSRLENIALQPVYPQQPQATMTAEQVEQLVMRKMQEQQKFFAQFAAPIPRTSLIDSKAPGDRTPIPIKQTEIPKPVVTSPKIEQTQIQQVVQPLNKVLSGANLDEKISAPKVDVQIRARESGQGEYSSVEHHSSNEEGSPKPQPAKSVSPMKPVAPLRTDLSPIVDQRSPIIEQKPVEQAIKPVYKSQDLSSPYDVGGAPRPNMRVFEQSPKAKPFAKEVVSPKVLVKQQDVNFDIIMNVVERLLDNLKKEISDRYINKDFMFCYDDTMEALEFKFSRKQGDIERQAALQASDIAQLRSSLQAEGLSINELRNYLFELNTVVDDQLQSIQTLQHEVREVTLQERVVVVKEHPSKSQTNNPSILQSQNSSSHHVGQPNLGVSHRGGANAAELEELQAKLDKLDQAHNATKKYVETLKQQQTKAGDNLRRTIATITNLESKVDSTSFDSFTSKIARVQTMFEERFTMLTKAIERKVDKEELDRLEKRNFAHVSKIFHSIQRFANKEEVAQKFGITTNSTIYYQIVVK